MRLAYKRPPPQPPGDPNPSRLGEPSPVHATRSPEKEKKGEKRRGDPEASHKYTDAAVKT
jgi:hypothetical protein